MRSPSRGDGEMLLSPVSRPSSAERRPRTASRVVDEGADEQQQGGGRAGDGGQPKKGAFGKAYQEPDKCAVPECGAAPHKGGLCSKHYG